MSPRIDINDANPAWDDAWNKIDGMFKEVYGLGATYHVDVQGADPTGVEDSTTAIQSTFDLAHAARLGSFSGPKVVFGAGDYKYSSQLVWKQHDIVGAGQQSTRLIWNGANGATTMVRTAGNVGMQGIRFTEGTGSPNIWLDIQESVDENDFLRDVFFNDWSATGVAAVQILNLINGHWRGLRFGSGGGHAIRIVTPNAQSSFSLDEWTIDFSVRAASMSGIVNVHVTDSNTRIPIVQLSNARIESSVGLGAGNRALVEITEGTPGLLGVIPLNLTLDNLSIQVPASGFSSLVHQATTGTSSGSQVAIRSMKQTGVAAIIGGNWSTAVLLPQGVPSAFIGEMHIGRYNSGAASTARDNWFFSILRARDFHTDVVATGSLPAAGANEDGRMVIEDAGAGDRNLIIYAGGQRFRIDGGAAF